MGESGPLLSANTIQVHRLMSIGVHGYHTMNAITVYKYMYEHFRARKDQVNDSHTWEERRDNINAPIAGSFALVASQWPTSVLIRKSYSYILCNMYSQMKFSILIHQALPLTQEHTTINTWF